MSAAWNTVRSKLLTLETTRRACAISVVCLSVCMSVPVLAGLASIYICYQRYSRFLLGLILTCGNLPFKSYGVKNPMCN